MPYIALARQWRPKQFSDVVGQTHIITALSHALTNNKIHHAYLFTGTHGTGKTTLARIFAKCLNCEKGISPTPCGCCAHCQEIDAGCFPDLYEIDAASRTKVEDTRELLDNIPYSPTKGKYKIYLIDEVHMLSTHSFNALLKTLEEPPEHVKFLLATTDPQKLPVTVLSRCLQFHLSKLSPEQIETQLSAILSSEKIPFEKEALSYITVSANGSMRDALSLLDQCIAYGNGEIKAVQTQAMLGLTNRNDIVTLLKYIYSNDAENALSLTKTWADNGIHFSRCLADFITLLYQISVLQSLQTNHQSELKNLAQTLSRDTVQHYYRVALASQRDLSLAPTAQIGFEMMVMGMMTDAQTQIPDLRSPISNTQKEHTSDWNTLLQSLGLSGPTLALAQHCSMKSFSDNALHLIIAPKYAALLNTKHQERIQEAFAQKRGRSLKVKITVEDNAIATPAESAERLREAQKTSAKNAISADQQVQRIVTTFGATVREESIEPLNQ